MKEGFSPKNPSFEGSSSPGTSPPPRGREVNTSGAHRLDLNVGREETLMKPIPLYWVDAFTDRLFGGNPAAVCPLEQWLDTELMQSVARENNLSETAFFVREGDLFHLRWFTPLIEIDLAGHPTLAAAHVIFHHLGYRGDVIAFRSRSGPLSAARRGEVITLNFPSREPRAVPAPPLLAEGLRREPAEVWKARDYLALFDTEEEVRGLDPDFAALSGLDCLGIIATAPGEDCDFVSRFFAPAAGIPEDPVTGSAHSTLIPFWARRLGKEDMHARQISRRGGELFCRHGGDRVDIGGKAVTYLQGEIRLGGSY